MHIAGTNSATKSLTNDKRDTRKVQFSLLAAVNKRNLILRLSLNSESVQTSECKHKYTHKYVASHEVFTAGYFLFKLMLIYDCFVVIMNILYAIKEVSVLQQVTTPIQSNTRGQLVHSPLQFKLHWTAAAAHKSSFSQSRKVPQHLEWSPSLSCLCSGKLA